MVCIDYEIYYFNCTINFYTIIYPLTFNKHQQFNKFKAEKM